MKLIALIHSSLANFNSDLACTEVQRHGHNTKTCSAPESAPGVDAGDEIVFFHGSVLYVLGRGVRCAVMVHNASACLMCCACALEQCKLAVKDVLYLHACPTKRTHGQLIHSHSFTYIATNSLKHHHPLSHLLPHSLTQLVTRSLTHLPPQRTRVVDQDVDSAKPVMCHVRRVCSVGGRHARHSNTAHKHEKHTQKGRGGTRRPEAQRKLELSHV